MSEPDDTEDEPEIPEEPSDSGPFCRHYHDPSDCGVRCARCGCPCSMHTESGCAGGKMTLDCPCPGFEEPEDEDDG